MTVYRDNWGIPHVRAESVAELAFEQGRVTAADRAWQLDIARLRAEGRTAALVGQAGVEWDEFARRSRLADTAQRAYAALSAETQAFVSAYVDGVNAAIDAGATAVELDDLQATPGRWEPWTPLGVFLVQHILFGSIASKLWYQRVADVAGGDALGWLRTEGLPHGSNAYAVGGGLTASGRPVVAGDPHRVFEDPNVYAQVRLACPEFDVVGFAFPGVPGVQHFAHAGDVAWGVTNAAADYQDVYTEQLERRDDGVWALGPNGWERCAAHVEKIEVRDGAPVEVEVIVTDRGPVFLGGPDDEHALSMRTTSWVLGDLGFEALLPLLRARTVADVDLAFADWVEPVNNFVIADSQGTVLHRVGGRVPQRPESHRQLPAAGADGHGWTGWVEPLPRTPVPADGRIVTANDRISAEYAAIGDDFAPSFRADRITELLDGVNGTAGLTVEEAGAVLTDARQNAGQVLLAAITELTGLDADTEDVRRRLLAWDGAMDADSAGAALFSAVRNAVVQRICAAPALAPLHDGSPYGELWAPWFRLPGRIAVSLHVILQTERPFGLDLDEVIRGALAEVATAAVPETWGDAHAFHAIHDFELFGIDRETTAPATPMPGDSDCVVATTPIPGTNLTARGPVARYVWDLADRNASQWAVPLGAAGDPHGVHHHDQHDLWAAGRYLPVVTDWDQLTEER